MGKTEMDEIASVVALVLKHVQPSKTKSGAVDRTKYTLDETVRSEAHARVDALLGSYPVYPEIDLAFLQASLGRK
jgi:glycine hydroxymethyltransferase